MSYQGQGGWGETPQGPGGTPGPGAAPPYQYQGGSQQPQTDGSAIAALILAICSFLVFPVILAIIALILASSSDKKIAESGGRLTGESLNKVARILSWINIGLCVLVFVLVLIIIIVAAGSDEALALVRIG